MVEGSIAARKRLLDPIDRISEILFGLIMALTFTGTLEATAGAEDVQMLLVGTIGCNIAWGLVDAVMFLIATLTERGRNLVTVRTVRAAARAEDAHALIGDALPRVVTGLLTPADFERLRVGLVDLPALPARPWLERDDWLRAVAVFLLVFLSTFPVVIPFLFISDVTTALRASNLVAIVMLFVAGYTLARHGGFRPLVTGGSMVLLGVTLVGVAIALGG